MEEVKVINHVVINGQECLLTDLSEKEREELAELWSDRIMAKYKRETA